MNGRNPEVPHRDRQEAEAQDFKRLLVLSLRSLTVAVREPVGGPSLNAAERPCLRVIAGVGRGQNILDSDRAEILGKLHGQPGGVRMSEAAWPVGVG